MKRVPLWWPPLLLLLAPWVGLVPTRRDLTNYFAPMREWTWARISAGEVPWLNPGNGAFEAWFANPQTGILYPPQWLWLVLSPNWALTAEISLHLAWLALGAGLLARSLGSDAWGQSFTEAVSWSCGPVIATVGVLNNLEALAWLPWIVLAARLERPRRASAAVAASAAACWLAGEPVVFGIGVLLAIVTARRRRAALAGLLLAAAVVAIQLLPFLEWVREGSRAAELAVRPLPGGLALRSWVSLLVPVVPAGTGKLAWLESLFLGAPAVTLILLGARGRPVLLAVGGCLAAIAVLPGIGLDRVFVALTAGLVRYPSRFALLAIVILLPLVGTGAARWRAGEGRVVAWVVTGLTLVAAVVVRQTAASLLAIATAAPLFAAAAWPRRKALRTGALVCGLVALLGTSLPIVLDQGGRRISDEEPWSEARDGGRLYVPPVTNRVVRTVSVFPEALRLWPIGYLNLLDGITLARSHGPIDQVELTEHLSKADRGPASRWWVDTLGARWVVLEEGTGHPSDWVAVHRRQGLVLYRNPRAIPLATVAATPPEPDRAWRGVGAVVTLSHATDGIAVAARLPRDGVLWLDLAPLAGWGWSLDGRPATMHRGPGVLQWLPLRAGDHRLSGEYRPPGLGVGMIVSAIGVLGTVLLAALDRVDPPGVLRDR